MQPIDPHHMRQAAIASWMEQINQLVMAVCSLDKSMIIELKHFLRVWENDYQVEVSELWATKVSSVDC